jgi:hypothetical protein
MRLSCQLFVDAMSKDEGKGSGLLDIILSYNGKGGRKDLHNIDFCFLLIPNYLVHNIFSSLDFVDMIGYLLDFSIGDQ